MGEVVKLPDTVEERAAVVREFLAKKHAEALPQLLASGKIVKITTLRDALKWGEEWQRYADSLEVELALAEACRSAEALLLRMAEEEILRLRGLLE